MKNVKIKVKKLTSLKEKSIGLIGSSDQKAVFFKTRFGIHTFGMKFPIDVLILDSQSKVVCIKENLVPQRIFLWNPSYENVIEIQKGFVSANKIDLKDKIDLEFYD